MNDFVRHVETHTQLIQIYIFPKKKTLIIAPIISHTSLFHDKHFLIVNS